MRVHVPRSFGKPTSAMVGSDTSLLEIPIDVIIWRIRELRDSDLAVALCVKN